MRKQKLLLLIGIALILIVGVGFRVWLYSRTIEPKPGDNTSTTDKPTEDKKSEGNLQKNDQEQLLYLRVEWLDDWEPGFSQRASQLIITRDGKAQWVDYYTGEKLIKIYTGSILPNSLLSKAVEIKFFKLKQQYVTQWYPGQPLPEGHPAQVIINIQTSKQNYTIFAEQKLMPDSLRVFCEYLKEEGSKLERDEYLEGNYLRITPVLGQSIHEIEKLGTYTNLEKKVVSSSPALQEALATLYSFVRLGQEEEKISEILGKKKGGHFYPFFKFDSILYKAEIYPLVAESEE
jgi:hypothetical protein